MNLFETLEARRSIRAFQKRPIEAEKLDTILLAATRAPSAGNLQAYRILLVRSEPKKRALVRAAFDQGYLAQVPLVLVFCSDPERSHRRYGERGATLYAIQDATIATAYAQLAATVLGLASCWVGAFDEQEVSQVLDLTETLRPVVLLPIGYPAESPRLNRRRPIEEMTLEVP